MYVYSKLQLSSVLKSKSEQMYENKLVITIFSGIFLYPKILFIQSPNSLPLYPYPHEPICPDTPDTKNHLYYFE